MPDPWCPHAIKDPGTGANYNAGRNRMYMAVDHDTGGHNSYSICKWGREGYNSSLCNFLFPKVGRPWQFAEVDAKTYHAGSSTYGDYNPYGPGHEVERLQGEDLTPDQIKYMGLVFEWEADVWGLPNVQYRGSRFPAWGADFHGHVNHRDIHPNPDGLSVVEWDTVTAPPLPPLPRGLREDEMICTEVTPDGTLHVFAVGKDDGVWSTQLKANSPSYIAWFRIGGTGTVRKDLQ